MWAVAELMVKSDFNNRYRQMTKFGDIGLSQARIPNMEDLAKARDIVEVVREADRIEGYQS